MTAALPDDPGLRAFCESVADLVEGPRVRVLSARCQRCGQPEWLDGVVGGSWTVAAAVLRELATQPHSDDCAGQMQFVTEPEAAP